MDKQIVISKYNEDLDWVLEIPNSIKNILIYNKGNSVDIEDPRLTIKNIQNVGREAQTWTHHIINNYNSLADLTFFLQGNPLDHTSHINTRLSYTYETPTPLTIRYMEHWPARDVTSHDLCFKYQDVEIRMGDIDFYGHRDREETKRWFNEIWCYLLNCPPPKRYYYGYGAMWAVPKQNILNRSFDFWSFLNKKLVNCSDVGYQSEDNIDGWAMEALWAAIFGDPNVYPTKI